MVSTAFPTALWTNQDIVLYHGTIDQFAQRIMRTGVDVTIGSPDTDFGKGFYTTTIERQARAWAWQLALQRPGSQAAIIQFTLPREALATLDCLFFALGTFDAEDFWSLVTHSRTTSNRRGINPPDGHLRTGPAPWYDIAVGPVTAFWPQRSIMANADQISFHTPRAEGVLNTGQRRVLP